MLRRAPSPALQIERLEDRLTPAGSVVPAGQFNYLQYSPTGELAELVWNGNALVFQDRIAGAWQDTTITTAAAFTQSQYGSAGQVEDAARTAQLVFTSDGTAHVLLLEKQWNGSVYATRIDHFERTAAGWQKVETITPPVQSLWGPNTLVAAAGPNGSISFVFTETSVAATGVGNFGTGTLNYATNAGGTWSFATIATTADLGQDVWESGARWAPRFISLAVDAANHAHVTYTPEFYIAGAFSTVDSTLMYATNSGGSWATQVVQAPINGGPADAGLGASIAVSPTGQVTIASYYVQRYATGSPETSELLYHTLVNGTWTSTVVANGPDGYVGTDGPHYTGFSPQLFFDAQGRPNIVFSDEGAQHLTVSHANEFSGQIRLATLASSTWSLQTVFPQTDPIHNQLYYPVAAEYGGLITFAGLVATTTVDSNLDPVSASYAMTNVNLPYGLAAPPVVTTPPIVPLTVPPPPAPPSAAVPTGWAVALDSGPYASQVFVFTPSGSLAFSVTPYGPNYTGGVRFALADLNGDGVPDLITVPTAGAEGVIRVFDGATGALIASVDPFPGYTGGFFVAAGNVYGPGHPDIVLGTDQIALPIVAVLDGHSLNVLAAFFAFPAGTPGGVRVAVGDINDDGYDDIVTAPGNGVPLISTFDGRALATGLGVQKLIPDFFLYPPQYLLGVNLTVGDINGDGYADIIGGTATGPAYVRAVSGKALVTGQGPTDLMNGFLWSGTNSGVRLAAVDADGNGQVDLIATAGGPVGGYVELLDNSALRANNPLGIAWLDPLPGITTGLYVG